MVGATGPAGPRGQQGIHGKKGDTGTANVIYSAWSSSFSGTSQCWGPITGGTTSPW
ncbi:MAG TPA: hypothetical protein VGQ51_12565 [Puia sp.]|nr:hypothetical protein [Puia sp.]